MNKITKIVVIAMIKVITGCTEISPQQASVVGATMPSVNSVRNQASTIGATANIAGKLGGVSPLTTQPPALAGLLAQQLGITPVQAMGGAGSIFSVARHMMTPTNFGQVSKAVPGMSQLLAAAPNLNGSTGGLMGRAANMLGSGNSLGQMAMLASSFQNLGLNAGMVNRFIPIILQYVQTQGGPSTMGLLQNALMP